jgi:hypothetical protein
MSLFPIASDKVQLTTVAIDAGDNYVQGLRINSLNTLCRAATTGGAQYSNGLLLSNDGQVICVDATAGLPTGTQYCNGLPLSNGALCISTGAAVSYSNGLPFAANGAVAVQVSYILDLLGVSAAAAYSTHQLKSSATNCVRVRRSSDNAELDIGFTASGGLDTAALLTFVGSQNLLLRSQEFENAAWEGYAGSAETIAANSEIAPDGTLTAERCTVLSSTSGRYQTITLAAAGQITCSVFIKAGSTGTWARIGFFDTAVVTNQARCWVNMLTGAIGTVSTIGSGWSGATASSTSVGNGWYRISLTATCTVTAITVINTAADADNTTSRTIGQNRIIWGAQLNTGATAQPYYATTNVVRTTGDGFVATWYDQSGNGRNATQTTAGSQPQIVSNGAIETQNGKPVVTFDGVNDFFAMTSPVNQASVTLSFVSRLGSKNLNLDGSYLLGASTPIGLVGYDDESGGMRLLSDSGGYFNSPLPASMRSAASIDTIAISSNVATLYQSGTAIAGTVSLGANFQPINIGAYVGGAGRFWSGIMSEILIFNSTLSTTNRQTLERNQGAYYGITVA